MTRALVVIGVVTVVGVSAPARAGGAVYELNIQVPKGWSVAKAKRGTTEVTVYSIDNIADAKLVVYPPTTRYGRTINAALRGFIKAELKGVESVYPRRIRPRSSWYGVKHGRLHAILRRKKGYALRVIYAFEVKGAIQILVAEAKHSRQVKKLLTVLSPVTMGCGLKESKPADPEPPPPPKSSPKPAATPKSAAGSP